MLLFPAAEKPLPFLLTTQQGEAARTLLSYVVTLPLSTLDSQLLAVVVAIRAARSGVGNLTGVDLRSLRLSDPQQAVCALRGLGWQLHDVLLNGDADTPVPVTVPGLANEEGGPLPFGKNMRSRVSGWTTRVLAAKPVKKTTPATRLAALFLAAHSSPKCHGELPSYLPEACHAALPELLSKGFLADLSGTRYQLDPAVRHLAGMLHNPADPRDPAGDQPPSAQRGKPWSSLGSAQLNGSSGREGRVQRCCGTSKPLKSAYGAHCPANELQLPSPSQPRQLPLPGSCAAPTVSGKKRARTAARWPPASRWSSAPSTGTDPPTASCAPAWDGTCRGRCAATSFGGSSLTNG